MCVGSRGRVEGLKRIPAWAGECGTGEGKERTGAALPVPCGPGRNLEELLLQKEFEIKI